MTNINLLPHKKNKRIRTSIFASGDTAGKTGGNSALLFDRLRTMEEKLDDPEYVNAAIYRLASIITERILNGGFDYEQEKK